MSFLKLTKATLSKLDSFSIEEKLNFHEAKLSQYIPFTMSASTATKSSCSKSKSDLREDAPEFIPSQHLKHYFNFQPLRQTVNHQTCSDFGSESNEYTIGSQIGSS